MNDQPRRPSDDADRRVAVEERRRNLLVDAGAGTGKTKLVVDRLLAMIAPEDDADAYSLERIAAITFTRRAAGELRLRIRQRVLDLLAQPSTSSTRRDRLLAALSALDTAFIGTIHSFADRLLRLCPVETTLSPSYDLVEDEDELVQRAYDELLHGAQMGTLAKRFADTPLADRANEVEQTIVGALEARIRAQTEETDTYAKVGLDWFVRELLRRRDSPLNEPSASAFEDAAFKTAVLEYLNLVRPLAGTTSGEVWMRKFGEQLRQVEAERDPGVLFGLVQRIDAALKEFKPTKDFDKGSGRDAWVRFKDGLAEDITAPIRRWMACRLVRIKPVAEAVYEETKRRHRMVDTVDLLVKLAELMRTNLEARASYQRLFDHVFVDEFQDTDPLQAEIILFLAEREPKASSWKEVILDEGKLTLVGDPKQSIYRFRRADVAMYEAIHAHVARAPGSLSISLRDNFRSVAGVVDWVNDRFSFALGTSHDRGLDGSTGQVYYKPLAAFRHASGKKDVHILPIGRSEDGEENAPDMREVEGEAIAQYIRWLIEKSGLEICDPHTATMRAARYDDVAVLARVTTQLASLFTACDRLGVPYSAAGGTLFLRDPLHRQFILGLRALADSDDGVAEAALLRPPFFSIDLWDVLQARAPDGTEPDPIAAERGRAGLDLVRTLRRDRFLRSPGTTARRLLDETAFGRLVALGPNGEQRLRHLSELCTVLDQRAADESLDFDGVTELARSWIDAPVQLDPSRPVWSEAVQVMSVHQAKGLEFPVVVLWDACGEWRSAEGAPIYLTDPARGQWALKIQGLQWEEPAGANLLERGQGQADWERRRVVYVAATRARDVLVVTSAPETKFDKPEKYVHALLADARRNVHVAETYRRDRVPRWVVPASSPRKPVVNIELDETTRVAWASASAAASAPRAAPSSVTAGAKSGLRLASTDLSDAGDDEAPRRKGRYGPVFGDTVHRAIGLAVTKKLAATRAIELSARATGLVEHLDEAARDVQRAVDTLAKEMVLSADVVRVEYPVCVLSAGKLVTGYIDLIASTTNRVSVIDFKTDAAPSGRAIETHREYVAQVAAYVEIVRTHLDTPHMVFVGGLLWTQTGTLEWVS